MSLKAKTFVPGRAYMPKFNPFGGGGGYGGGPRPAGSYPSAPPAPAYSTVKQADGMPVHKHQENGGQMMYGNPMMMSAPNGGDTLDSLFSTGDKLISTMMSMESSESTNRSHAATIDTGLGLSNPLFSQASASPAQAAKVSTEDISKELKTVVHLVNKTVGTMNVSDATQEMQDLCARATKSWERAKEGGQSDSEKVSNLVDVKVALNTLEQVSYMNIQMPASDKAKLMNIITSIRSHLKAFTSQNTKGNQSLRRSSIVSSMVNLKAKMQRKIGNTKARLKLG